MFTMDVQCSRVYFPVMVSPMWPETADAISIRMRIHNLNVIFCSDGEGCEV
jgi:hypothetical protein